MALADYLRPATVCMDMQTGNRKDLIHRMLQLLVEDGQLAAKLLKKAEKAILDREKLGSTAIGRGIAVPHARLAALDRVMMAFGHCPEGVEFHALDGAPVHDVFLVMGPPDSSEEYVSVLQHISELVQNEDFRRFLAQTEASTAVIELIDEMDP